MSQALTILERQGKARTSPGQRNRHTSPQSQLSRLDILHPHPLPIQQIAQPLRAIALIDALPAGLGREIEHEAGELVDGIVDALGASIDDVDAVVGRILDQFFHVAAEAREVRGDAGHAHDRAFGGGVSPRLVVGGEDAEMGAADEIVVVEGEDGVGGVEEFGVEDDLDAVGGVVEELHAPDLVEDGVFRVVGHVVRYDGWEAGALHAEEAAAEHDLVGGTEEVFGVGEAVAFAPIEAAIEEALADASLDHVDGVSERFDDGLAF